MSENTGLTRIESKAIVLQSVVSTPLPTLLDDGVKDGSYILGFDPHQPGGEARVFLLENEATDNWENFQTDPFPIETWGCKRVPLYDETARDYVPVIRTVLISPENRTIAFTSDGVVVTLDLIRALRGDGPYVPPIMAKVRSVKTRRGYKLCKLEIVTGNEADGAKRVRAR